MAVFSFHPVKHVTTGEGGAITTARADLADRLRRLRTHGITRDPARMTENHGPWYYELEELGFNYRITDLQCALGRSQLAKLSQFVARRREIAAAYREGLGGLPGVVLPAEPPGFESSYHLFPVWFEGERRAEIFARLQAAGLGVQVHYVPVHLHPYYRRKFGTKPGDFPEAERFYRGEISIPMFPKLTAAEIARVIDAVRAAVR
jgi:dTDP-4-amino-4,6-dideoxygalactose transaminase